VYCSVVRLLFLRLVPLAELGELTTGDVPSLESLVLVERFFRRFALSRSGAGGERLTVERSLNGKLVSNICSSVTTPSPAPPLPPFIGSFIRSSFTVFGAAYHRSHANDIPRMNV